jgi:lysophospholipase L1-like esterase
MLATILADASRAPNVPVVGTVAQAAAFPGLVSGGGNTGVVNLVAMGDSMTAALSGNASVVTVARSGGIATLVISGNHGAGTGEVCRVYNCSDTSFNTNGAPITYVSGTVLTYSSPGPDVATATLNLSSTKTTQLQRDSIQNDQSYLFWLNTKSKGAFRLLANRACNGQNSTDMLARYAADVVPLAAGIIIIWTGYNDFNNSVAAFTADQVYANVVSMIAQSSGKTIVVIGAVPWTTNGSAGTANTNRSEAIKYNRKMRAYCNANGNLRFADAAKYLIDATNATRFTPLTGMMMADGIHPSPKGQERVAQAIWDVIQQQISQPSRLVSSNADNYATDNTNPNINAAQPWTASGGVANGSPATSGTVSATLQVNNTSAGAGATVASVAARSDAIGFDQVIAFTPALAADNVLIGTLGYTCTPLTPGDKIVMLAELTMTGIAGSNLKGVDVSLVFNSSPTVLVNLAKTQAPTSAGYPSTVIEGVALTLVSPEFIVPAGVTGCTWAMVFSVSAAGSALTAKLGRISVEKII